MFKRHNTRYEGQKRVPVRHVRDNESPSKRQDNNSPRNSIHEDAYDNGSPPDSVKSESGFTINSDPTVPAIQMNDDSMDQARCNMVINFFFFFPQSMFLG